MASVHQRPLMIEPAAVWVQRVLSSAHATPGSVCDRARCLGPTFPKLGPTFKRRSRRMISAEQFCNAPVWEDMTHTTPDLAK